MRINILITLLFFTTLPGCMTAIDWKSRELGYAYNNDYTYVESEEEQSIMEILVSQDSEAAQKYLNDNPNGNFAGVARGIIDLVDFKRANNMNSNPVDAGEGIEIARKAYQQFNQENYREACRISIEALERGSIGAPALLRRIRANEMLGQGRDAPRRLNEICEQETISMETIEVYAGKLNLLHREVLSHRATVSQGVIQPFHGEYRFMWCEIFERDGEAFYWWSEGNDIFYYNTIHHDFDISPDFRNVEYRGRGVVTLGHGNEAYGSEDKTYDIFRWQEYSSGDVLQVYINEKSIVIETPAMLMTYHKCDAVDI